MGFETPVKLNENVYLVGCNKAKLFNPNVYLYKDEDVCALIDPAWTQAECMLEKIAKITDVSQIKYIIIQNYEPDTVKVLDLLKKVIPEAIVVTHWKISTFLNKFDIDFPVYIIDENDWKLKLKNNELDFIFTPFNYFAGSFCTYDVKNKTLFTSELFSAVKNKFQLFVDKESVYMYSLKMFHELYLPNEYMKNAITLVPSETEMILPKYGSVLEEDLIYKAKTELLNIIPKEDYVNATEQIMSSLFKTFVFGNIQSAVKDFLENIQRYVPTASYVRVAYKGNEIFAGKPTAKKRIKEIYKAENGNFILEIGINSTQNENEIVFLQGLAKRAVIPFSAVADKEVSEIKIEGNPIIDSLTGLFTIKYIDLLESKMFKQSVRHNFPISMALLNINIEQDGHVGELYKECILREVSKILKSQFRSSDVLVKLDGNEFLIIMPFTPEENAFRKIEHVSEDLEKHAYCGSKNMKINVSFVVDEYDKKTSAQDSIKELRRKKITVK